MGNVRFKLQNIFIENTSALDEHWWMMYRGDRFSYNKKISAHTLKEGNFVEFFTYFNTFSIAKWRKYTNIGSVSLNLTCRGHFKIQMFGHYTDGNDISKELFEPKEFYHTEKTEISLTIPTAIKSSVIGFQITALDFEEEDEEEEEIEKNEEEKEEEKPSFYLYDGCWSTLVDSTLINDVRIAVTTVTFKKEDYITGNMAILERELFYTDEPAAEHIRVRIIDNGRTLDPEDFENEYIQLVPNENTGGSGGYTRGIIEAINDEEYRPTHILLMDDDVMVLPESFIRTYSLLALVKKEYDERFISGAMLFYEHMNIQHEDVGFVHDDGSYGPNKPDMELHLWNNVLKNDQDIKYHANSYAGWWYCCVPVKKIDRDHLPIPLFIRGDDVEFSLANHAEFLSLNGICIWHRGFTTKFNACLELYQVHRNSLIIQAMSGICQNIDFIKRIDGFFWKELCRLAYNNCELLLDAIEEFCNGPEFLFAPNGEQIMKEHSKKNEVMYPAGSQYPDIPVDFDKIYQKSETPLTEKEMKRYTKTCNGQTLPDSALKDTVAVIAYDWFDDPAKQYMAKEILAVNPYDHTAYLRKRDKNRFKELVARQKRVMKYYETHKEEIERKYAESANTLKTESFWRKYLHMD